MPDPPLPSQPPPTPSPSEQQKDQQQQKQQEEIRQSHLARILTPEARTRLARLATVRAERARAVEEYLLQNAMAGRIRTAVSEADLVQLLEQVDRQQSGAQLQLKVP